MITLFGSMTFSSGNRISPIRLSLLVWKRLLIGITEGGQLASFDGELKEIDNRGRILRGKLILSAGAVEIDCVMNKERVPEAREAFDKRVIIEGTAHYDRDQQLPTRIDVSTIRSMGDRSGLLRWRGAFTSVPEHEAKDEWC